MHACKFLKLSELAVGANTENGVVLAHGVVVVLQIAEFVSEGSEVPGGSGLYVVVKALVDCVIR